MTIASLLQGQRAILQRSLESLRQQRRDLAAQLEKVDLRIEAAQKRLDDFDAESITLPSKVRPSRS